MPDPQPTEASRPTQPKVVVYQPSKMDASLAFLPGANTAEHNAVLWGLSCLEMGLEEDADHDEHREVLGLFKQGEIDDALALLEHLLQGKFITLTVWDPNGQEAHA